MDKSPWRCVCLVMNTWAMAYCEMCGEPRPATNNGHEAKPTRSCWTCDACHERTPGQPVLYQDDGPGGQARGLCSSRHFELRIRRVVVRASDEEVRQNIAAIKALSDRVAMRMML